MKKLTILTLLFAAFAARADLLYFLVDGYTPDGPVANFDFAMVGVADEKGATVGYLNIQPSVDSGATASPYIAADNSSVYSSAGPAWADLSDYTTGDYKFYIETYRNDSDVPIWGYGVDTAMSYSQLLAGGHIYQPGVTDPQDVTPWQVPEPTSGMLLVLGFAALGLRRKMKKVVGC